MGFLGVANAIWILPGPAGGTGSGFLQIAGTPTSTTVLVRNLPLYGQATPGQVVATGAPIYLAGDLNFAGNGFSGLCPALDGAATSVLKGDSTVGSLPYSSLSSLPTLGTSAPLNVPASGNASSAQVVLGTDTRLSDARALSGSIAESSVTNLVTDLAAKVGTADSRLSDARTPTAHHATHAAAGSDPLTLTKAQISDFPTLGTASAKDVPSSGNASSAQVVYGTDTRLSDARTPSAHETTHLSGGADAIPLASSTAAGLCPTVDNTTIQVSASKLAVLISGLTGIAQSQVTGLVTALAAVPPTTNVQTFTTPGAFTWTKPAGALMIEVICIGGGGGGGSGRRGLAGSARSGGQGGGGGAYSTVKIPAAALGSTVVGQCGLGGTGGASQTTASTGGNTATSLQATTGDSFFGGSQRYTALAIASGGIGGFGGAVAAIAVTAQTPGQFAGGPGGATSITGASTLAPNFVGLGLVAVAVAVASPLETLLLPEVTEAPPGAVSAMTF